MFSSLFTEKSQVKANSIVFRILTQSALRFNLLSVFLETEKAFMLVKMRFTKFIKSRNCFLSSLNKQWTKEVYGILEQNYRKGRGMNKKIPERLSSLTEPLKQEINLAIFRRVTCEFFIFRVLRNREKFKKMRFPFDPDYLRTLTKNASGVFWDLLQKTENMVDVEKKFKGKDRNETAVVERRYNIEFKEFGFHCQFELPLDMLLKLIANTLEFIQNERFPQEYFEAGNQL